MHGTLTANPIEQEFAHGRREPLSSPTRMRRSPTHSSPTSTPSSARPHRTATGRCSSSPVPAPARPRRSPIGSRFLIARGVDPGRILLLTFTRRAASEMLRRVDGLLRAQPRRGGRTHVGRARLGRHLPRDGGAAAAHPRARHRPRARLHDHGPRRLRGPHAPRPHRTRPGTRRLALPAEVDVPRHLLALRQRAAAARRGARHRLPVVPRRRGRPEGSLHALHRQEGGAAGPRLRRPAAVLARAARATRTPALASASASTTCSSTSTRTPTLCRPRSSRSCAPTAPA